MTSLGDFKKGLSGLVQSAAGFGLPVVHQLTDLFVPLSKAADDGSAAATTADTLLWTNPYDFAVNVVGGRYTPTTGGIVADNANFATVALKTDNGAGGGTATALSFTTAITDTGNLTQNQSKAFTLLTAANQAIPPGGGLWLNIAKAASGVVVRAGLINVRLQRAE